MLQKSRWDVYSQVKPLASSEQTRYWYRCAQLLQVDPMTTQWAEALLKNKIESIEELSSQNIEHIQGIFKKCHMDGKISKVPTLNQISVMLKDATTLHYTGHIAGTVINKKKKPVVGAKLNIGYISQKTNSKGRFRLLRIPLAKPCEIIIQHPKYQTQTIENPNINSDIQIISPKFFKLVQKSDGVQQTKTLSELAGDVIPSSKRNITRLSEMKISEIKEGDLFFIYEFYKTSPHAKMVSYLEHYRQGIVVVHFVKVPKTKIPANSKKDDKFRIESKKFSRVKMSDNQIHRYKLLLRMKKEFPHEPKISNPEDLSVEYDKRAKFLKEQGFFDFNIRRKEK